LDVVEIDPEFCEILSKKFENNPHIRIHCTSIADWQPGYEYDAVVSGLPLNSFPPEYVEQFIDTFKSLTKKGGTVSYFEYEFLPRIKLATLFGEEERMFRKVLQIKQAFFEAHGIGSETVYRNFPPARVLHFQPNKTDEIAA
jgi:phospholipid N-methyltransferase